MASRSCILELELRFSGHLSWHFCEEFDRKFDVLRLWKTRAKLKKTTMKSEKSLK